MKNLSIFYFTSGTEKTRIVLKVLGERYNRVALMSEGRSDVSLYLSVHGVTHRYAFPISYREGQGIPSVTRYMQLSRFWLATFTLLFSKLRGVQFDLCVCEGMQGVPLFLVLSRLGMFKKIVYYSLDWFPNKRFTQLLDKLLVTQCDETWNYTEQIIYARHLRNKWTKPHREKVVEPVYSLPKVSNTKKLENLSVCYLGSLRADVGIDLVMQAIANLKRQQRFKIFMHLIGTIVSPNIEKDIYSTATRLEIGDQVVVHGFVKSDKLLDILGQCMCGFALFPGGQKNYSNYAIPGKVREYLENGVPVILNRENAMAKEVESERIGIVVDLSADSIANALSELIDLKDRIPSYRENAISFAYRNASPERLYRAIESAA